jgi:HAE1 family hydrophobic/amphiphilic exporter-1
VPPSNRDVSQREFEQMVLPDLTAIPDVRLSFANTSGAKDVSITLVSDDKEQLAIAASALEQEMRSLRELSSVVSTAGTNQPELIIIPDLDAAARLGVSAQAISDAVNYATIGDLDSNLAKFTQDGRQVPVRARLPFNGDLDLGVIKNLRIPTTRGGVVTLSAVATVNYGYGPTIIERYNYRRTVSIEGNLNGVALGTALEAVYDLPAIQRLPVQVKVLNTGDAELVDELFRGFIQAVIAGLMLVYAIQVLLYKDWIQPFTRMAALPLSIGGAFFALLVTGTDLSLPAIIGILMLMGIADKNSILLVDYMLELINRGHERTEAILTGCKVRAQPIIMTSLAMLAGMLPIALGIGLDTAFRAPMAIAVIGGLISSTALSLIFVPVLFSYVRDFEEWLLPRLRAILA